MHPIPSTPSSHPRPVRPLDRPWVQGLLYSLALAALIGFASVVQAQSTAPFAQDPLEDGVVSIEAEHPHGLVTVGAHSWVPYADSEASGGGGLQCLPNNGTRFNTTFAGLSPRADYQVQFNRAGVHYLWVRGYGPSSSDDTLHVGLNGAAVATSDLVGAFSTSSFSWDYHDTSGIVLTLPIPSAGLHTLNVWMREDGCVVDKIVLTSNPGFTSTGEGPPESLRVGENAQPADPTYITSLQNVIVSNGVLLASFTPLPGIESYQVVSAPAPGGALLPDPSGITHGYGLAVDLAGSQSKVIALRADRVPSERELAVLLMNRLAYGPSPHLLSSVLTGPAPLGAVAFLDQQLAPETLAESADADPRIAALRQKLDDRKATLADLRAWFSLRAVHADRQFLEVLLQFFRNHFTTECDTSQYYLEQEGLTAEEAEQSAVDLEFRQIEAWRAILLNPNATFLDLLTASLKSPAMMIYLDSVLSTADSPNENYPREILELYTMGVDNGYTQTDIEALARVCTGFRVRMVDDTELNNPFAPPYQPDSIIGPRYAGWKYRKGTTAPPANWMQPAYVEDASWLTGQTSIGYGDGDDATVLTDMAGTGGYNNIYFRRAFTVTGLASLDQVTLRVYIDDGFVAYLNGQEVFRYNAPGTPGVPVPNTARASGSVGDFIWQEFVIHTPSQFLVEGANLLAVHGLNSGTTSSDFSFDAEIVSGAPGRWGWVFDAAEHDPTNKVVFANARVHSRFGAPWGGQPYTLNFPARAGNAGLADVDDMLAHLANLPQTMEYLSVKLCQALVHENFHSGSYFNLANQSAETRLLLACMRAWDIPGPDGRKGNLRLVLRAIFESDLFRSQHAAAQKVKTPFEFCVSAVRALRLATGGTNATASTDGYDLRDPIVNMGMRMFNNSTPDGYPEEGNEWIDSGTIAERMRFVQNLCMDPADPLKNDDYGSAGAGNVLDPTALVDLLLPNPADRADAGKVTDLFLGLLFPGTGAGNLTLERDECLRLLNSDDSGVAGSSPFPSAAPGSPEHRRRLRALAGLLLASPRFQEQ